MLGIEKKVETITDCKFGSISAEILKSTKPLILKGLVSDWPMVKAGLKSNSEASKYIISFYKGESVVAFLSDTNKGRFSYDESIKGFNYHAVDTKLDFALEQLNLNIGNGNSPAIYIGSTAVDTYLPGFSTENELKLNGLKSIASIWISNRCQIAAHWDGPNNLACSVVGRRRFTLFPPDQLENLYVGPLDKTPAGQSISLVDFYNPDFEKYPKFKEALSHAQVADLEPGDALFIPSMWWHHVESLGELNVLVNYWVRDIPSYYGNGLDALIHSILSIKMLPEEQRQAWKKLFNHYVFEHDKENFSHIPSDALGSLGDITETEARKIRSTLLNRLNK
jgi:hypothetical protein